jgi:hypothetical protein
MNEENQIPKKHYEIEIENDDGTFSKILEVEQLSSFQLEPSDQKDKLTISLPCRIQVFRPITIEKSLSLTLNREFVRKMAESLGLIDS